ncbi:DUF4326 domain-containing protein [Embleya sp. NPDC008237]|uniref:DUF4326 domain-containing protein n=1 Tax=Embleya sp. NPDC008237 TaxID=3363978 RepID=UPI0036EEEBB2
MHHSELIRALGPAEAGQHDTRPPPRYPERVQRRRTKGWRMPPGAIYVGRGSVWGNPFRTIGLDRQQAVEQYEKDLARNPELVAAARTRLRGHPLACWCPLVDDKGEPVPCHVDVLLRIANEPDDSTTSPAGPGHP